jgi:hypothetical protein
MDTFRCELSRPFRNLALFSIGVGTLGMVPALWGIAAAVPTRLLGLPYLRLSAPGLGSPLWLPLFLAGQSRFDDLARAYSPPASPLVRALEDAARAARG